MAHQPWDHVAAMLVSTIPVTLMDRAARRFDLPSVRRWLLVTCGFAVAFLFLRWQDFLALNLRWDTNAYGSVTWATVGFHGTVLLLQVVETLIFAAFMFSDSVQEKHFTDASDTAFYWYFMVGSWVVLYLMLYWSPRLLP